jgi:hypothetical protein
MNKRNAPCWNRGYHAVLALLAAVLILAVLSIVLQRPGPDGSKNWGIPALLTSTASPSFDSGTPWWTDMPTPPGMAVPSPTFTPTP